MFKNNGQSPAGSLAAAESYTKPLIVDSPDLAAVLPATFLHGYASASYQIEGGYQTDGRGPCVWDEKLKGMENGDVAVDSYRLWRDDVELLKKYGATGYRFSVSWSRVIPLGGKDDPINQKGLDYYSNLIDALLEANITPFITLFHWDTPLELEKRYNGWLAAEDAKERLLQDFDRYAELLFMSFGDRVKDWITHNEWDSIVQTEQFDRAVYLGQNPMIYTMLTAAFLRKDNFDMDSDRWLIGNNLLLAHARAVDIYRARYQSDQKGRIGITLNIEWMEPFDESVEAKETADRCLGISAGWFADPIYLGRHNKWARQIAGSALGDFTNEEWKLIKGSSDFFGLNHYSTRLTTGKVLTQPEPIEAFFGGCETRTTLACGRPIGNRGYNGHPFDVPWGFKKLLHYVQATWTGSHIQGEGKAIPIYVTENGFAGTKEAGASIDIALEDTERQIYFEGYLRSLIEAVKEGVIIKGYFGWSLLDNLEWNVGYNPRFGVTFVDRSDGFKRYPKKSTDTVKKIFEHAKQQA